MEHLLLPATTGPVQLRQFHDSMLVPDSMDWRLGCIRDNSGLRLLHDGEAPFRSLTHLPYYINQ
jgi:hypothetical protein